MSGYSLQLIVYRMEDHRFAFENLRVYEETRTFVKEIYLLQNRFPKEEKYALGDQVRRAASSILFNIAEGSGRVSLKEKIHFIEISYGSLMESFSEIQTAQDLGYIKEDEVEAIRPRFIAVAKMLSGLKSSYERTLSDSQ